MSVIIGNNVSCASCGKPLALEDQILLPEVPDEPSLAQFSGRIIHFACLPDVDRRCIVSHYFLHQLGQDGITPSGKQVGTFSENMRYRFSNNEIELVYAPLLLMLKLPIATAIAFVQSRFTNDINDERDSNFSGKGFDICLSRKNNLCELILRTSPQGLTPSNTDPQLIRIVRRRVSCTEMSSAMRAIEDAVNAVLRKL
jgi:hypothetical protein